MAMALERVGLPFLCLEFVNEAKSEDVFFAMFVLLPLLMNTNQRAFRTHILVVFSNVAPQIKHLGGLRRQRRLTHGFEIQECASQID